MNLPKYKKRNNNIYLWPFHTPIHWLHIDLCLSKGFRKLHSIWCIDLVNWMGCRALAFEMSFYCFPLFQTISAVDGLWMLLYQYDVTQKVKHQRAWSKSGRQKDQTPATLGQTLMLWETEREGDGIQKGGVSDSMCVPMRKGPRWVCECVC